MAKEPNPAQEMIRSTFTAPNLSGDEVESPLLDRAREMVDDEFPTKEERAQRGNPHEQKPDR